MDSTIHVFNVVFKMESRSPTDPYEITNMHVFNVTPVYWTTEIIPGKGVIYGRIGMNVRAIDIMTASIAGTMNSTAFSIPKMYYSASLTLSGCTIFAACPVINVFEEATS